MWLALALAILSFLGGLTLTIVGATAKYHARPSTAPWPPADPLPPAKIADGRPFPRTPKRGPNVATVFLGVLVMIGGPIVCLFVYAITCVHWGR